MSNLISNAQFQLLASSIEESLSRYRDSSSLDNGIDPRVNRLITESKHRNPWFIPEHMEQSLSSLARQIEVIAGWEVPFIEGGRRVAVLLRTDAPMEGIAEMFLMVKAGVICLVKTTEVLKYYIADFIELLELFPAFAGRITILEENIKDVDAVVSFTVLDNTFKEYLAKYPLIELAGKGSSCMIQGNESDEQLQRVVDSACMYFGRCRDSLKVLLTPSIFNESVLEPHLIKYSEQLFHNRYYNNYEYRKAAMIINQIPFMEIAPVILCKESSQAGYTSVLHVHGYLDKHEAMTDAILEGYPLQGEPGGDSRNFTVPYIYWQKDATRLMDFINKLPAGKL